MQEIEDILNSATELIANKNFTAAKELLERANLLEKNNVEVLKNLGLCLINLDDFEYALSIFKKLVKINKEDASSYFYLANCEEKTGNVKDAQTHYIKVIELREEFLDAYKSLAALLLSQGQFEKLNFYMDKAISVAEDDYQFYYFKASAALASQSVDEAIKNFELALKFNPAHQQILNNLGACYISKGNFKTALSLLEKSFEINPNNAVTLFNLGTYYQIKSEFGHALKYYEGAYKIEPTLATLTPYATCAMKAQNFKLAAKLYKKLIAAKSTKPNLKSDLMFCMTNSGDFLGALKIAKELLEENPKSVDIQKKIVHLYRIIGENQAALDIIDTIIKRGKIDDEIFYEKALCALSCADYELAMNSLKKAIKLNPKNAFAHKDLGLVYMYMNHPDFALNELKIALSLAPDNDEIVFSYATSLNEASNYAEAEPYFKKAIKLNPKSDFYLGAYGVNLLNQNKIEEAKKVLTSAHIKNPINVDVGYNLAKIYYNEKKYKIAKEILTDIWDTPHNANIVNLLAMCHFELKEYKPAASIFKKLLEFYPENHVVLTKIAQCDLKLSNYDEAKEFARRALVVFADFSDALKILKKIKEIENG